VPWKVILQYHPYIRRDDIEWRSAPGVDAGRAEAATEAHDEES
jgi:hypothetical protein